MKIGNLELEVSAPDAERLLASTGQSIAAMRELLEGHVIANIVAKAMSACVKAEHDIEELTARIASEGVSEVRAILAEHYARSLQPVSAPAAAPAAEPAPASPVKEATPQPDQKAEAPKEPSGDDGQK